MILIHSSTIAAPVIFYLLVHAFIYIASVLMVMVIKNCGKLQNPFAFLKAINKDNTWMIWSDRAPLDKIHLYPLFTLFYIHNNSIFTI